MRPLILLLCLFGTPVFAQKTPFDVVPPSPNAARISLHGVTSTNLSNGTISPSVPLFNLDEYGLSLPVYAQYSYRGYRPSELTGILGNGWDLLAGGTISRVVNGTKDEKENAGFYHIGSQIKASIEHLKNTGNGDALMTQISHGEKDSAPDRFFFNFGSYSGSFFTGSDGKFRVASQSKIEFKADYSPNPPVQDAAIHNIAHNFLGFTAKVEDGTVYRFFACEYSKSTTKELGANSHEDGVFGKMISAWHLSEIIGPNGQKITFEYSGSPISANRAQFSYGETYLAEGNTYPLWTYTPLASFYDETINLSHEIYLQRIKGTGWKLEFSYEDYETNTVIGQFRNYPKRLTNISYFNLYDWSPAFIKGFNFTYENFGDAFSLSSIKEVSANHVELAPYLFTYYGTGARPIHSKAIDHYGFFNGKTTNNTLAPAFGANREPVLEYAQTGALSSMRYPTGGKDNYQYELNRYSHLAGQLYTAIAYHDSLKVFQVIEGSIFEPPLIHVNTNTAIDIEIVVLSEIAPECGSNTYTIKNYNLAPKSGNAPYTIEDFFSILTNHGYCFGTPSTNPSWDDVTFILHVTAHYPYITRNSKGPGIRIASITRQDDSATEPDHTISYEYMDTDVSLSSGEVYGRPTYELWGGTSSTGYFASSESYNSTSSAPINYHTVTEFHNGVKKAIHYFTSQTQDGFGNMQGVPVKLGDIAELGPLSDYSQMRGLPKGSTLFANNLMIQSTGNQYGSQESYTTNLYKETALYMKWYQTKVDGVWQTSNDYAKFYYPVSYWFYPLKQETIVYDANGQNPVTSTTELFYDNPEHYQVSRKKHTNSDGTISEEKFKYPLDYKNVSGKDPMLDSLINNHRANTVIERTLSSAGTVLDAQVYTFAQHTGNSRRPRLFLPVKEYRFQASGSFAPYTGTTSGISNSSYYENSSVIVYDTLGHPLSIKDAAGVHTSVIRAYRSRYIVGHITNALKTDVDFALSSAGTSYGAMQNATDNSFIQNTLSSVQGSMSTSLVSGFLYNPFVGMTRNIQPNGTRTNYEYDAFGRLSGSKDHNGNWLNTIEYHYRGTNTGMTNHTVSRQLRMATTNASNASNHLNAASQYEFFNAFGEPWQKLHWRQNPQAYNIISENNVRDNAGRLVKTHLPVAQTSTSTTPLHSNTVESAGSNFYNETAFNILQYRGASGEISLTRGPGTAWATNNKNVSYSPGTAGSAIRKYTINSSNNITLSGTYPAYSIISTTVTDEQGNITTEYKDKKGLLVERQAQISSGQWAVTHFIYDGTDRLRAVIQPEGYALNSSITSASAAFTDYVFCYEYDARGRIIRKHIPGAGWTEIIYDKANRPVMSQDAYQKTLNRWSFTQYDAFGREVVKGETTKSTTRASAQALFDAHAVAYEGRSGATYNGASFPSSLQPALNDKKQLNYYDDYTFLESQFAFNGSGAFHSQKTNIKGLPAGAKKRNSRDNAKLYTDAFYYDDLNRMIQSQHTHQLSSNNTSNILVKNLEYNFAGEVTRKNSSFPFHTGTVTLKDKTDYDHAGRVTAAALGINAEPADIIHYDYDEIGRLKQKKYIGTGSSSSDPCDVLTDGLVIGTWTATGHPLVARYFHNKWWLVQRIGTSPDRFIVRGSEMISRSDVSLNNSAYASLVNCFEWKYSDFEGIIPPPTPSVFPVPSGYDFVNENGEEFFRASSSVPCSTPTSIVPSVPSPAVNQQLTLTTSCATGTPKWNTNATTNSITVTATASAVTYSVTCQGSSCTTSSAVSITITGSSNPCNVLTDGLVIGTWTVTGHPLVARYFHNKWWLVQRIGTSPDRFIVRGSEMISRSDVTLNNSAYASLVNCFEWKYSDFEGIIPPATPSVFPVPSGYDFVNENGEEFFRASSSVPCSTPTSIVPSVPSPAVNQQLTLTTSCATGTPKWNTNATTNSITVTATASAVTYSVTCQGSSCTTSSAVSITITGTPVGPCDVLTDGLVIGTWTVTGHPLVARYFHNKWWLVQRIGASPEQFVVRASEMISRPDVTLNNSAYASLENCFEWQSSNYGGLAPPATPSVFAIPPNYSYLQDSYGEYYFQQNSGGRIAAVEFSGHTEPEDSQVKLFPNPAGDRFDVKIHAARALKEVSLSVTDMSGRVIYSATVDIRAGENTYPINSAAFSNGTYMVSLHKGLYRKSAKVIIMK